MIRFYPSQCQAGATRSDVASSLAGVGWWPKGHLASAWPLSCGDPAGLPSWGHPSFPTHSFHSTRANVPSRFSCVRLFETPWTVAHQAPLSMGFSREEYPSGLPFPPPGDLPDPGIKPTSPTAPSLQADPSRLSHQESPTFPSSPSLQVEAGLPAFDCRQSLPLPGSRFPHLRLPRGTVSFARELSRTRMLSWP